MDDRVGDILAQRARLERSVGTGVAFSLLLHGALTAAALVAALRAVPPQTVKTVDIRFAPMASASTRAAGTKRTPAKPAPPAPVETPAAPRIEQPMPEVEKPAPAKPVEKNTVPLSPFGRSTKKGSETAAAPPPKAPASVAATSTAGGTTTPGTTAAGDIAVGTSGVTGLEGGDFPYTMYIDRMKTLVGNRWFRPQNINGPVATVYFVIERDGTIRDAKLEVASGNGTFDRAALRSVIEASPLPPLPFGYNGTYLGVHLTFK